MTEWIAYETLTWPEVKKLERSIPLVIPLGAGYELNLLSSALNRPQQAILLPSIPYGWRNSGLAVAEPLLVALLKNLVNSLRDDGFTQVFILAPPGICLELGADCVHLPPSSHEIQSYRLPADGEQKKVVLVPIGHTEQHAFHLPMNTDTLIIEAISLGVSERIPAQATSLAVMPYGVSTHRQAFAGTLNAGGRAFEDFYVDVLQNLVTRGFERIYLLSGHGGNCSHLTQVVKMAGERWPHTFIATAWLYLSGPQGIAALGEKRESKLGGMGHAGELETSFILFLHPEWVHMQRVVDEVDFISTPSYTMDWVESGALVANPPWEDDTLTGAYGAGSLGTAEKGSFWYQAAIDEKIEHVQEIHEQFQRRFARRLQRQREKGKINHSIK
jgi:creatinine amidohydrolase